MRPITYERWKKRQDQKGKQSIPSAGNQRSFRQGRIGARKKVFWPKLGSQPTDFSIWPMEDVQSGMLGTIQGSNIPESAQNGPSYPDLFFYIGAFFQPLVCYISIYYKACFIIVY